MMKASAVIVVLVLIAGSQAKPVSNDTNMWFEEVWNEFLEEAVEIGNTMESFYGSRLVQNLTEKQKETRKNLVALIENSQDTVTLLAEDMSKDLSDLGQKAQEDAVYAGGALSQLVDDIKMIVSHHTNNDKVRSWLHELVTKPRDNLKKHLDQLLTLRDIYNQIFVQVTEKVNHTISELKPKAINRWTEIKKKAQPVAHKVLEITFVRLLELRKFLTPQVHELDRATGSNLMKLRDSIALILDSEEDTD